MCCVSTGTREMTTARLELPSVWQCFTSTVLAGLSAHYVDRRTTMPPTLVLLSELWTPRKRSRSIRPYFLELVERQNIRWINLLTRHWATVYFSSIAPLFLAHTRTPNCNKLTEKHWSRSRGLINAARRARLSLFDTYYARHIIYRKYRESTFYVRIKMQ